MLWLPANISELIISLFLSRLHGVRVLCLFNLRLTLIASFFGFDSIIQRAGIVPLSIAGIFKEVSTIIVSSWVFGDELTKLNMLGVLIAVGGESLNGCPFVCTMLPC